jgi:hypothetical protein
MNDEFRMKFEELQKQLASQESADGVNGARLFVPETDWQTLEI